MSLIQSLLLVLAKEGRLTTAIEAAKSEMKEKIASAKAKGSNAMEED